MNLARRTATILAAFAAVSATTVITAGAAHAAYSCEPGQLCVYQYANYTGSVYVMPSDCVRNFAGKTFYDGEALDNAASSVRNLTASAAILYTGTSATSAFYVLTGGDAIADLSKTPYEDPEFPGGSFDNVLSGIC